jgi:outer membrane immunogenic protein
VNSVPGHKGEVIVKNLLLAGIALVALAAPAAAADMPVKALPPAPIDIWTGGYVGANVGYDWGRDYVDSVGSPGFCSAAGVGCAGTNYYSTLSAQAATFNLNVNHSGLIYGGQAGHNWLVHNIAWTWDGVLGVEVDFQGKSDSHGTTISSAFPPQVAGVGAGVLYSTATMNERIDTLGTLRGRAGLLWGPNTLVYLTGGVAWASARSSTLIAQNVAPAAATIGPYAATGQASQELFGPVIGAGVEWKWTANWSIKAEYLYVDLGNLQYNTNALISPFAAAGGGAFSVANVNQSVHIHDNIARVGVNYKFW